MLSGVEQKTTVNLSKVAFLSVRGIDRYPLGNQSFLIHFWRNIAEVASRILNSLLNHLLATGCGRMVVIKGFGAREPIVPLSLVRPGDFQVVAEKESQMTDYLPELPFFDMRISPDVHQPLRYSNRVVCDHNRISGQSEISPSICGIYQGMIFAGMRKFLLVSAYCLKKTVTPGSGISTAMFIRNDFRTM